MGQKQARMSNARVSPLPESSRTSIQDGLHSPHELTSPEKVNQLGQLVKMSTKWKSKAIVGFHNRSLPPREQFSMKELCNNALKVDALVKIGSYRIIASLGEGAFAKVKLATHIVTGEKVAIKIFDKTQERTQYERDNFFREADMSQRILNQHCCQLLEIIDTRTMYVLVFELIATDVLKRIEQQGTIAEREARRITRELIAGIQAMHAVGIVHRDLKPENIGLAANETVKILDFGLCGDTQKNATLETQCGTLTYSAPELLSNKKYGPEVDIWSIAVVLYAMLTGKLPYGGEESLTKIHANMLDKVYERPKNCSPELEDLFDRMFEVKPKKRITISELWEHPWIIGENGDTQKIRLDSTTIQNRPERLDVDVLNLMKELDFQILQVKESVGSNLCDRNSSTYHLLVKAKERNGGVPQLRTRPRSILQKLASIRAKPSLDVPSLRQRSKRQGNKVAPKSRKEPRPLKQIRPRK